MLAMSAPVPVLLTPRTVGPEGNPPLDNFGPPVPITPAMDSLDAFAGEKLAALDAGTLRRRLVPTGRGRAVRPRAGAGRSSRSRATIIAASPTIRG